MAQFNKLIIVICFMFFYKINAQEEKRFYITKDTIILKDASIVSLNSQDGMFLVEDEGLKKKENLKKILTDGKFYLFSNDIYRFLDKNDFKKVPKYNDCTIQERFNYDKNITVRKLNSSVQKFVIGLVRIDYYNEKIITVDKGKTFFHKKNKYYFYKIAFPICD